MLPPLPIYIKGYDVARPIYSIEFEPFYICINGSPERLLVEHIYLDEGGSTVFGCSENA